MGDSSHLGPDDIVAFVDASEQDAAKVNGPDTVVNFFEPYGMLLKGIGKKEQPLLEPNRPGVGAALDEEMTGIFDRRQRARVGPLGRTVERRGRPIAQGLVRPFVIIETAKSVEGARQSVLAKEPIEDGLDAVALGGEQTVARQEIPGVLVGDRQRVAVDRVPRAEVTFEVGGPEIVGLSGQGRDDAGMLPLPSPAPLLDQSATGQKIARGADGRPLRTRVARLKPGEELGRPPARMLATHGTDHRGDVSSDTVGAVMRRPTPITQSEATALAEAREPFVARLAADAVA